MASEDDSGATDRLDRTLRWLDRVSGPAPEGSSKMRQVAGRVLGVLRSGGDPAEPLLQRLRGAPHVLLVHPPSVHPRRARRLLRHFLRRKLAGQRLRLAGGIALVPLCAALSVLPTPNVLLYFLLYRVLSMLLCVLGARRALRGLVPLRYESAADQPRAATTASGALTPRSLPRAAVSPAGAPRTSSPGAPRASSPGSPRASSPGSQRAPAGLVTAAR